MGCACAWVVGGLCLGQGREWVVPCGWVLLGAGSWVVGTRFRVSLVSSLDGDRCLFDARQEIAWFLEEAIGVTCKTQWYASGDDVVSSGRYFAHHFQTQARETPALCVYPVLHGGIGERIWALHYRGAWIVPAASPTIQMHLSMTVCPSWRIQIHLSTTVCS